MLSDCHRHGVLFCFCGPSGSGKSTICQQLIKLDSALALSVSCTTRSERKGEKHGVHYYFLSPEEFKGRISAGDFVEHAVYNGNHYGTSREFLEQSLVAGKDILLDIDVQGVTQLKQVFGTRLITVFVYPPSIRILEERIRSRGTESEEIINQRLEVAKREVSFLRQEGFADYLLLNDRLETSVELALSIVKAERMRFRSFSEEFLLSVFGNSQV